MRILVCGGAGYIGSHAVAELLKIGHEVIVIDNLATGHKKSLVEGSVHYEADLTNINSIREVFLKYEFDAVMHFAASSLVGDSIINPLDYYYNNVYGTMNLIQCMKEHKVSSLVFSSTAATYGVSEEMPIREEYELNPTNPYGDTKLAVEKLLKWASSAYGINYVALRYFNVAGAHPNYNIGEDHNPESHIIPIILATALGQREYVSIFGDDYCTHDGTCVRDYIHVLDLVDAHIKSLDYLRNSRKSNIFNLGNGEGFSVKELINVARDVTGKKYLPR